MAEDKKPDTEAESSAPASLKVDPFDAEEDSRAQDNILDEEHTYYKYHPSSDKHKITWCNAIFATRQLASRGNRDLYLNFSIRECVIYIFYLATITTIVVGMASSYRFYYTRAMHLSFVEARVTDSETENLETGSKSFETSSDVFDFWNYLRGPLVDALYWEHWYGRPRNLNIRRLTAEEARHGVLYENQLIGSPRLRQLRVRKTECPVEINYRFLNLDCYPDYSESVEDTGREFRNVNNKTIGIYWSDADTSAGNLVREAWKPKKGSYNHWGKVATYSGNGGVQNLKGNSNETADILAELQRNRWITRATRAIFLDFTVYNANLNLFCVIKLLWEFPSTGGLTTSYSLRTVTLIRYVSNFEFYVVLPCEILFLLFTIYYLIQEIVEMIHLGCSEYIKDIWSWFDIGNLLISFLCIYFTLHQIFLVKGSLETLTKENEDFADFEFLAFSETQFTSFASITVFFAWLKIFKYVSFNETMAQLANTLTSSAWDVLGFSMMFFIVFFAFAQLGHLIFGSQLEDYQSIYITIFTLLRILLGDFNFRQLQRTNPILGPIYFLSYAFFLFFVLINMFLAIINDTYAEVKKELATKREAFEIADYFKRGFNKVRGVFGKRSTRLDAEAAIKMAAEDGQITQDELRQNLDRSGRFHAIEIEMFLSRFDLEEDTVLDEEGIANFLADLEGRDLERQDGAMNHILREKHYHRQHLDDILKEPTPVLAEEFDDLTARVISMEVTLTEVLNNIVDVQILVDEASEESRST